MSSSSPPIPADAEIKRSEPWEQFYGELRGYVTARLKSESEADDIVQDAFLRAHRAAEKGLQPDNPRAWLYQIAKNLMNDSFRGRKRKGALEASLLHNDSVNETSGDEALAPESEVSALVARSLPFFLASLDAPYAEALRLVEIEGLSHAQAANKAQVSLSCMKARVRRGRSQLLSSLRDCCSFEVDARGKVIDWKRRKSGNCSCS